MAQHNEIPADHAGFVLKVVACGKHGAHINVDYHIPADVQGRPFILGPVLELDQMGPDEARRFAKDLNEAADVAEAERASGKN